MLLSVILPGPGAVIRQGRITGLLLGAILLCRVASAEPEQSRVIWTQGQKGVTYSFPSLSPDGATIYVGSDAEGESGKIWAAAASDGKVLWTVPTDKSVTSAPVVAKDGSVVYVGSRDYKLYALKASSGLPVFTFATAGLITASPTVSRDGDWLYVSSTDQYVYALAAADGGLRWKFAASGPVQTSPAESPDGKVVYVSAGEHLTALNTGDGSVAWAYASAAGTMSSSPAVTKDGARVLVGNYDGSVHAVHASNGSLDWRFVAANGSGVVETRPSVSADGALVFLGSNDGSLYALRTGTGEQAWTFSQGRAMGQPVPSPKGNMLYVGSVAGVTYALDATTGRLLETYLTGSQYAPVVVSADGRTVISAASSGDVVALAGVIPPSTPATSSPKGRHGERAHRRRPPEHNDGTAGGGRASLWPLLLAVLLSLAAAAVASLRPLDKGSPQATARGAGSTSAAGSAGGGKARKEGVSGPMGSRRSSSLMSMLMGVRAYSSADSIVAAASRSSLVREEKIADEEAVVLEEEEEEEDEEDEEMGVVHAVTGQPDLARGGVPSMLAGYDDEQTSWRVQGVTVGAKNLSYSVQPPQAGNGGRPHRLLLHDVTFCLDPGDVAFVMGPSGAGKSTLLQVISGRVRTGAVSGLVLFNGKPRGEDFYARSAYVPADDQHLATLTVAETMHYAALLRFGDKYSAQTREQVGAVLELMGLTALKPVLVGDPRAMLPGLTDGQRRRLSIAVELVHMPSLLLLDAPTAGLDAATASEVMSFAHELSKQLRTILTTMHQPSVELLGLASKVVVLKDGRLAYSGPPEYIVRYFTSPRLGFAVDDSYHSSADFMLACVSGKAHSTVYGPEPDGDALAACFRKSELFETPYARESTREDRLTRPSRPATGVFKQTLILMERLWVAQSRDTGLLVTVLVQALVVGLGFGLLFFNAGKAVPGITGFNEISDPFTIAALMFLVVLYPLSLSMWFIPHFSTHKDLFLRERKSGGTCSTGAFTTTTALACLPLLLTAHVLTFETAYWLIGLSPSSHVFALLLTCLHLINCLFTARLITCLVRSQQAALWLLPLVTQVVQCFLGFLLPFAQIHKGWRWLSLLLFPRWSFEALVLNEFQHRPDYEQALWHLGLMGGSKWDSVAILIGSAVILHCLTLLTLTPPHCRVSSVPDTALLPPPASSGMKGAAAMGGSSKQLLAAQNSGKIEDASMMDLRVLSACALGCSRADLAVREAMNKSTSRIPACRGVDLLWRDLEVTLGKGVMSKKILKGVSGQVMPGEICAVMGGFGAGKSTLLELLALRLTAGKVDRGEYYIGGRARIPSRKWCAYVSQDGSHMAGFTVRETLRFAAMLRLSEKLSRKEREERADDVMEMMGLAPVANVAVGERKGQGLSFSQCRRLSMAVEILQLCPVLFLDEPTTGLDSTTALEIMAAVRAIADCNRTVVCTVERPSEAVLSLFDKLVLMAVGRQTYYGPAKDAVAYFSEPPIGWVMPAGRSTADFLLEAAEAVPSDGIAGSTRTVLSLHTLLTEHRHYLEVKGACEGAQQRQLTGSMSNRGSNSDLLGLYSGSEGNMGGSAGSFVMQGVKAMGPVPSIFAGRHRRPRPPRNLVSAVAVLSWRKTCKLWKTKQTMGWALARTLLLALLHGSLFFHLGHYGLQSRLSLLYLCLLTVMLTAQPILPELLADRAVAAQEQANGLYGSVALWLSSALPLLPYTAVSSLAYSVIVYQMAGLAADWVRFAYFLVVLLLCAVVGLLLAQLVAFSTRSSAAAVPAYPALLLLFLLPSGFFVHVPDLPAFLRWAATASFARWAYQGLVMNEVQATALNFRPGLSGPSLPPTLLDQALAPVLFGDESFGRWASLGPICYTALAFFLLAYLPARFLQRSR